MKSQDPIGTGGVGIPAQCPKCRKNYRASDTIRRAARAAIERSSSSEMLFLEAHRRGNSRASHASPMATLAVSYLVELLDRRSDSESRADGV